MFNTVVCHSVSFSTVNKIISEWKCYIDFMVYWSTVNCAEDYKNLLCRDEESGGSVAFSSLFSNYLFRVHYKISINTTDYDCIH